jgi:hypothetical protein
MTVATWFQNESLSKAIYGASGIELKIMLPPPPLLLSLPPQRQVAVPMLPHFACLYPSAARLANLNTNKITK